jgi:hypothetical protein
MNVGDKTSETAASDLRYIREILETTHRRIDPHAFHFVLWGAIVLVWYPVANLFERAGRQDLYAAVGGVSFVLGMALSWFLEFRQKRRPRLEGENTFVSRQVTWIVFSTLAAGIVLSGAGPGFGFIEGREVPTLWGLVYATMAFMVGVVYSPEYRWAGVAIFVGALLAMAFPGYNGVILGPFMGIGMIVPGLLAERRVRRMRREDARGA